MNLARRAGNGVDPSHTAGTAIAAVIAAVVVMVTFAACGGDAERGQDLSFAADVGRAAAAVEAEIGAGQAFFEITATPKHTNVFVATDDATVAVPYVFLDGELQPPAPALDGASGYTFGADALDYDADAILAQIAAEVPGATIESLSVVGGDGDTVRYVVAVRSAEGGWLDVTVAPDGRVLEVDPV